METNTEIWKDIVGFEELYKISNYGNVKSCKRLVNAKSGQRLVNERLLSLGKEIRGLKSDLIVETRKGKRAELTRALTRANRSLKKLM